MRFRSCVLALMLGITPTMLLASKGTPGIGVDKDPPNPTVLVNNDFSFGADANGGGDFSFKNESGQDWLELSVFDRSE